MIFLIKCDVFMRGWTLKALKQVFSLSFVLSSSFVEAKLEHKDWQELNTPHFRLFFDRQQKDLALKYAVDAEFVYDLLIPHFSQYPSQTFLVISDDTDLVNASATFYPYPLIKVNPKQPLPFSFNFIHYGFWSRLVLLHEYVHILQMTPGGRWQPFRWLFGNALSPNSFLPRWYMEGMAVDLESRFSRFGRMNSPLFYADVRGMVDEGTWETEDISRFAEQNIPTWPFGRRPYFFGSILLNEIINEGGLKQVDDFNQMHARKSKIFLNQVPKALLNTNYQALLQSAYTRWRLQAEKDLAAIGQYSVSEGQKLPMFNTRENIIERHTPRISPDGRHLVFIQNSKEQGHQVIALSRAATGESFLLSKGKVVALGRNIQSLQWINNEEFVFDRVKTLRKNNISRTYSDLYKGFLSKRRPKRITFAQRLQFVSLSWDGQHFLAIQNEGEKFKMVQVSLDGKQQEVLYAPQSAVRLSTPLPLTEHEIVFVEKAINGPSWLRVWNRNTQQITNLSGAVTNAILPSKIKGGLLYTSDVSGVPNLYFWNASTQKSHPVTNSKTAIREGIFDEHARELWISQLHSDGYRLEVHKSQLQPVKIPLVVIPHALQQKPLVNKAAVCVEDFKEAIGDLSPSLAPACLPERDLAESEDSTTPSLLEDSPLHDKWQKHFQESPPIIKKYNGLSYLRPNYWVPFFNRNKLAYPYRGKNVDYNIFIYTGGSDPLAHHSYQFKVNYHTLFKKLDGSFRYDHYKLYHFDISNSKTLRHLFNRQIQDGRPYYFSEIKSHFWRTFFLNSYLETSLGWMFFRSAGFSLTDGEDGRDQVDENLLSATTDPLWQHGPYVSLRYSNAHPDSFLAQSERFYLIYSGLLKNAKADAYNEITGGLQLTWRFPNPLGSSKPPAFQNDSLRYHSVLFKSNHTFKQITNSRYYIQTTAVGYNTWFRMPLYHIRGYPSGTFGGRRLHSFNLEYTLPIWNIQKGYGTHPLFLRNMDLRWVFDAIALEGSYIDRSYRLRPVKANGFFSSLGAELRLNTTVEYRFPFSMSLGIYYGFQRYAQGGWHIGWNLQIPRG